VGNFLTETGVKTSDVRRGQMLEIEAEAKLLGIKAEANLASRP